MTVDYITQQLTIENDQQLIQPNIPYQEPLYLELKSFADSIINDTTPSVTGEDGLKTLWICEAALKSSRTGKQVRLP